MNRSFIARAGAAAVAAAFAATSLAACGRGGDDSTSGAASGAAGGAAGGGDKVVLLVSTLNNPFFVDLRDGAMDEAAALGIDLEASDAQDDSSTQTNQAQNAQAQGAKAVIINPVDSDAAGPAVTPLESAGIPVVSVDRSVEGAKVNSHIASDNVAGGKQAAEELAKAIGEKGKVLELEGVPGASATRDRGEGFNEGIKAFSGIEVAAKQTANFDRAEGLDVATNLMQANPDVTGIFAHNDEMALGAVQALGAKAGKDVFIFGFDGTDDGLKAVQDGTMAGTIAQQPKELGKIAVQTAAKLLKGETVEELIDVPVTTVTKDNVADFIK